MLYFVLNMKVYFKETVSLIEMFFEKYPTIHYTGNVLTPDFLCYGTSSGKNKSI